MKTVCGRIARMTIWASAVPGRVTKMLEPEKR
jgi:hypothetical protein